MNWVHLKEVSHRHKCNNARAQTHSCRHTVLKKMSSTLEPIILSVPVSGELLLLCVMVPQKECHA